MMHPKEWFYIESWGDLLNLGRTAKLVDEQPNLQVDLNHMYKDKVFLYKSAKGWDVYQSRTIKVTVGMTN